MTDEERSALLTAIHNATVDRVVGVIVKPSMDVGGGSADVLVILESVVFGVIVAVEQPDYRSTDAILEWLVAGVRDRIEKERLKQSLPDLEPAGRA